MSTGNTGRWWPATADPRSVAVIVVREGRLPAGADEAAAEAGDALVIGRGSEAGARALAGAARAWWLETGPGFRPGAVATLLAPVLAPIPMVVLPASPDGRDLAPRLAALLDRALVAGAVQTELVEQGEPAGVGVSGAEVSVAEVSGAEVSGAEVSGIGVKSMAPVVRASVSRLDDRVLVPVEVAGPAVVTLVPGSRSVEGVPPPSTVEPLASERVSGPHAASAEPENPLDVMMMRSELEPDLHTMDLADAHRVFAGGAGLAAGLDDRQAAAAFAVLADVAAALGGSEGATRVATDAGWTGPERQIGTTGVTIDPDLYVAFGISGATQHVAGLGRPGQVVSVNTDPSAPMTGMADLGLVTDARALLLELAPAPRRRGAG